MSYIDPATAGTPAEGQVISPAWGDAVQTDIEVLEAGGNATSIYGTPVGNAATVANQILIFSGSKWVPSSLSRVIVTQTTSYVVTGNDDIVLMNGASLTLTLPAANVVAGGKEFIIKNLNASSLTIATSLSQTIDGIAPSSLAQWGVLRITSDGVSQWYTI